MVAQQPQLTEVHRGGKDSDAEFAPLAGFLCVETLCVAYISSIGLCTYCLFGVN